MRATRVKHFSIKRLTPVFLLRSSVAPAAERYVARSSQEEASQPLRANTSEEEDDAPVQAPARQAVLACSAVALNYLTQELRLYKSALAVLGLLSA